MPAASVLRLELPPVTERIARLPVHRGYPVPWFVGWLGDDFRELPRGQGQPDFRVLASDALERGYNGSLCWICGERRGHYAAFVAGPMCAVNRTSAEPPSHPECAGWAACACPFLVRPHAHRREAGLPEEAVAPAGISLTRNPGVALVWASGNWSRWAVPGGGHLFNMGDPAEVAWFAEGRKATRAEVEESITSGLPTLHEMAVEQGPAAVAELERRVRFVLEEVVT